MKAIVFIFLAISVEVLACSNHPGISHEQWTSSVKDERTQTGSVKVFSDNFFSSKGGGAVGTNSPDSGRGGERPIRTIKGN